MGISQHLNFEGSLTSSLVLTELRVMYSAFKYRNQGKRIFLKTERFTFFDTTCIYIMLLVLIVTK